MKAAVSTSILTYLTILLFCSSGNGQSYEVMFGHEHLFVDAQYLKFFDATKKVSLFSRTRATSTYEGDQTDLFTAAYINYTSSSGFGPSLIGRISSFSSGIDAGVHYFKARKNWMVFALPSIHLNDDLLYSWFSLCRITPHLKGDWYLYISLELFSAFNSEGYINHVQRLRLGPQKGDFQFGVAANLQQSPFIDNFNNLGGFIRVQFK